MPEQVKIIQRRLLVLNQRVLENTEHRWSECVGISGRNTSESMVGMHRNQWSVCIGIGGRYGPDYASVAYSLETMERMDRMDTFHPVFITLWT